VGCGEVAPASGMNGGRPTRERRFLPILVRHARPGVPRFPTSHTLSAPSDENPRIEGTLANIVFLVRMIGLVAPPRGCRADGDTPNPATAAVAVVKNVGAAETITHYIRPP